MDIFGSLQEVWVGIEVFGFKAALEEGARPLVAFIKVLRVSHTNPVHKLGGGVCLFLMNKQVKVVRHEAVGD